MPSDVRIAVDEALVQRLIAAQFPQWAALAIRPVDRPGWDNRTFRLGDDKKVRLPSAERYAAQATKEHRWLPLLASMLPLAVPVPLALGEPAEDYEWPWSVQSWLEGEPATRERVADMRQLAASLAQFLIALQRIPARDGPAAGPHSFFRGGPLSTYDAEMRASLAALHDELNVAAATAVWDASLAAQWRGLPVWVHGDIAAGNLLVREGQLHAVIDFGCCAVGDPACDLVIAWTFLDGESQALFRTAVGADPATWARARGWALWKAVRVLCGDPAGASMHHEARSVVDAVLAEHRQGER
jgi:aminoglycoside phosphotransferase (APT) family kinase protein